MIDETRLEIWQIWRNLGIVMIVVGICICLLMFAVSINEEAGFSGQISSSGRASHWSSEPGQSVNGKIWITDTLWVTWGFFLGCLMALSGLHILHAENLHKRRSGIDRAAGRSEDVYQ